MLTFTGIFLTLSSRFVQIRYLVTGLRNTFSGLFSKKDSQGISPFAALSMSLGAQLGTGNIVGAGAAVLTGGPGAIFWMWVSAFFGMATSYAEALLSQKTKVQVSPELTAGGAPYYIKYAFRGKAGSLLSSAFCLFSTVALGFTGAGVQANSISTAMKEAFCVPLILSAVMLTAFAGVFLSMGTEKIAGISKTVIPAITLLYTAGCAAVLIKNFSILPRAFYLIFKGAFSPGAVLGTATGISLKTVISQGFKRGLFTNEAGMGSTAAAHAVSNAPTPHYQGTMAVAGVFIDTFFMMTLTSLALICVLFRDGTFSDFSLSGSGAVSLAFADVFGTRGAGAFIAMSILFFAFSSIIGWSTMGKVSCTFLFSEKSSRIYTVSSLAFVFAGALIPSGFIWSLTDICNTFMVLTNVPALIRLYKEIRNC